GYIVTNAHVTDLTHQGEDKGKQLLFIEFVKQLAHDYGKDPRAIINSSETMAQIQNQFQPREFRHIHHVILPNGKAFPFEIKAFGAPTGEGKDVSVIKIEVKNAPVLKLGNSDKIQLQDHITVLGYPAAADTDVLSKESALEASITDGKVSAKKSSSEGAPILQVSAPSTHGNSGGPVLNDKGEVIGMLTFRGDTVNGQEVQGFNFVVPSSTIMEYVKQAGATNEEGIVDKRYREGLELYWDNHFSAAIDKFKEVGVLFKEHSETERLIRDSQQAISEGKEKSNLGLIIAVVVGVLAVSGGAGAFIILRNKKMKPAAGQMAHHSYQANQSYQSQQPYQPQQFQPQHPHPSQPGVSPGGTQVLSTPARTDALGGGAAAAARSAFGAIRWTTGPLTGQRMDIRPEGMWIGRDPNQAQVKVDDTRVSSRHLWIGPREGRVVIIDQGSTNGTFLNTLGTERVREVALNPGDTVILSQADAARFVYER
ncbi:MAG: trypsin-like peptidase domain-containing protein, partial [Blastocatellia bacterium]